MVRPHLEYCSCLWSPYTVKRRGLLENVQRRSTKFILHYPSGNVPYSERLATLNLLWLEHRREIRDVLLFHKLKSGAMSINCTEYSIPTTSKYATRNADLNNLRARPKHKQNYFIHSYFQRAIKLWNFLPQECKNSQSSASLKQKLFSYYKCLRPFYVPP